MKIFLQAPETCPVHSGDPPDTRCTGRLTGRLIFVVIPLLAVLLLAGCGSSVNTAATRGPPSITATPNPVPAGRDKGTSKIAWTTGNGSVGQVYVSEDGKPEKLFAAGSDGSKDAPWIRAGVTHEFRLYAGKEHKEVLASVSVTRSAN
jgi:hypothetical protein